MRWEIPTGSLHLSEFDPYFQFRFANHMVENGLFSWVSPEPWIDTQRWYPDGQNMARVSKPLLPFTAALSYKVVSALGINIQLLDFCAILPAIMGMLACLVIYFLGKDFGGRATGLLASLFLALSPSYLQRSQVGFFDTETLGILSLILFTLLFLRSIEKGRSVKSIVGYALASGATLGCFIASWGAAYYAIGVTALFAFIAILAKRYTSKLFLSYSLTFGVGLFIAITVGPDVSYLTTAPVLAAAGVFFLLTITEIFQGLESTKGKIISILVLLAVLVGGFAVLWQLGYVGDIAGKFTSVLNPVVRGEHPLIRSVAEHRITAWGSIYHEWGIGILFFIVGLFFVVRKLDNKHLFLLIWSLTSLYFASSMVRLLVLMAPAFAILASMGVTRVLKPFKALIRGESKAGVKKKYRLQHVGREFSGTAVLLIFLVLMTNFAFPMPKVYSQAWSPVTVTAGSLPVVPNEPVQEWFDMLQWTNNNLQGPTVVCSWWDYGYWLTVMGNVTSLADNATINSTQIQNIGYIFMSNETQALEMLKEYDAKYILTFTTLALRQGQGQQGQGQNYVTGAGYGDEGKWMWMARISGNAKERLINQGFMDEEDSWTDEEAFGQSNQTTGRWEWNPRGMNSTIYKLMAWGQHSWSTKNRVANIQQRDWMAYNLTSQDIKPTYFKEAYFAGLNLSPQQSYGGLIPLVCLYEIDWESYNADYTEG
ncbi:MAG: STT3 domain-containing protein [Thermoproteota archaeon]